MEQTKNKMEQTIWLGGIKSKPRSKHAEWIILNRLFGTEMMKFHFNDYKGYESTREEGTSYQDIYEELVVL